MAHRWAFFARVYHSARVHALDSVEASSRTGSVNECEPSYQRSGCMGAHCRMPYTDLRILVCMREDHLLAGVAPDAELEAWRGYESES